MAMMFNIKYDGKITIAVGRSRKETKWKNQQVMLSEFLEKVSNTTYTEETYKEFLAMKKSEQDDIKDVGGFVGGPLIGSSRKRDTVKERHVITLDADYAKDDLWDRIETYCNYFCIVYSTHKHCNEKQRLRVVIPLKEPVTPDEYEAISRRIAEDLNIDYFDDTTYEPSRLMYWPSTSKHGDFVFKYQDEPWLDGKAVLATYKDWMDVSSWPVSCRVEKTIRKTQGKISNPKDKNGIVGSFCRAYSIHDAIKYHLQHVYSSCQEEDRYTFKHGTSYGGLVVYENGDFAYSHHSTDPAAGRLLNSFDLVRLHKFGHLDKDLPENMSMKKRPSYVEMLDYVSRDDKVKVEIGERRLAQAQNDFNMFCDYGDQEDNQWLTLLEVDKNGAYKNTINNVVIILENDPMLKEIIGYNEFSCKTMALGSLPWREIKVTENGEQWVDSDDAGLRDYFERVYKIVSPTKISDGFALAEKRNSYHPIRNYLNNITWDGKPRLESLFIDYLGAENSKYTKAVTKKMLMAAVARVFEPGVKFDYMMVLVGPQGIGKSHIVNLLGGCWYSDSLNTVLGKEAYEQLQDAWIIEMAELSATKKAEIEAVKHFISKREDSYRQAYGKRVEKFPRQCVFFGTTNDVEFLKDRTGNRRFLPVTVGDNKPKKNLWDNLTKEEVHQIWAEAMVCYKLGETLHLDEEVEVTARKIQNYHTETTCKEGIIMEYLDRLLPSDWNEYDVGARRRFIHGTEFGELAEGTEKRTKVCTMEIWVELFNGDPKMLTRQTIREINEILRSLPNWAQGNTQRFGKIYGVQRGFFRK